MSTRPRQYVQANIQLSVTAEKVAFCNYRVWYFSAISLRIHSANVHSLHLKLRSAPSPESESQGCT